MSLQSNSFSMGVEEEYQIIDPHTRELSQSAHLILPKAQDSLGNAVQYEMILKLRLPLPFATHWMMYKES